MLLPNLPKILFTKHAHEKFDFLKRYNFEIDEEAIIETIKNPVRLDQKKNQIFATRPLDKDYALRVVYEKRKEYLVVITFYPVRRERYGI